jgi:hypothetical protein
MFALPGITGLIALLYLRPSDIFEVLSGLPLLHVFLGLALVGVFLDLRLGVLRLAPSPLTTLVAVWAVWNVLVTAIRGPLVLMHAVPRLLPIMILYFVLAHGVQTMQALSRVVGFLMICIAILTAVGVHQAIQPRQCVGLDPRDPLEGKIAPDGRACLVEEDCDIGGSKDVEYICEKVGVFDIYSTDGRVRYTGTLRDPNELALTIALGIPILYLNFQKRRDMTRLVGGLLATIAILYTVVHTGSRGGLLIVGAVFMVAAVRHFGWKGVVVAVMLASPLMLLSKSRADADASSNERMELLMAGFEFIKTYPIRGIGMEQFSELNYLTAHNAYVLTASEQGFPGGVLWTSLNYMCAKISLKAWLRYRHDARAATAAGVAFLLLSSFAGMCIGVFFLSFAYHYVYWTYVGLSGALYGAIRLHDPKFKVSLSWNEVGGLVAAEAIGLGLLFIYVSTKVHH